MDKNEKTIYYERKLIAGAKVYKRETPDGTTQLECPKCHHEALKEWHHPYCWHCGQKLDWED